MRIRNKAVRYEILESKALNKTPANCVIGNLNTGDKRSGDFKFSEKQMNMIVSVIKDEFLRQEGVK